MTRILFTLGSLSLILLATALVLGLSIGDLYAKPHPGHETLHWATVHRLVGVAAALAVVFVESVIVTYFIGTSRWCKEVAQTYRLDPASVQASNRLKRGTFPWALAGMLAVVAIIALGAAADPATGHLDPTTGELDTQEWTNWHLIGAFLGIMLISWTYVIAWNNIAANHAIIEQMVAEVARIRRERGMD